MTAAPTSTAGREALLAAAALALLTLPDHTPMALAAAGRGAPRSSSVMSTFEDTT